MADEVPVCDVLCEAMEYLSKLGSNLRSRSENLREKRIRKDKLKNFHAVQKAADKVLLICQLSKKSLENVECGVRRVLSLMGAGQESTAADAETPSSPSRDTEKYRYFKYRSYKLKVARTVPVKHYLSVRVLARNMPMSMHEKYPVYHNCKLYRTRKRIERELLRKSIEKIESANQDSSDGVSKRKKSDKNPDSNMDTDVVENSSLSLDKQSTKERERDRKMSVSSSKSEIMSNDKPMSHPNSDSDESVKASPKKLSSNHNKRLSMSSRKSNSDDDNNDLKHSKRRDSKSNYKKIRVIDDEDSLDSEKIVQKNEMPENLLKDCHEDAKDKDSPNKSKNCENTNEKPLAVFENSTNMQEATKSLLENPESEQEVASLNLPSENTETEGDKNEDDSSVSGKPLIKCVNIQKLLKPDLVDDKEESHKKKSKSKNSITSDDDSRSKKKKKIRHSNKKKEESPMYDEEFWVQKRKEVSAFVSKKFCINVTRLPKLSENFLHLHNLRKIVQSDRTICEISNIIQAPPVIEACEENNKNNSEIAKADSIKNALLNDSDSEKSDLSGSKSPLPLAEIEKTVQDALLNDADAATDSTLLTFAEINKTIQKVLNESLNADNDGPNKTFQKVLNESPNADNDGPNKTIQKGLNESENEKYLDADNDGPQLRNEQENKATNTNKCKNALLDSDSDKESSTIQKNESGRQSGELEGTKNTDLKQKLLAESDSEGNEHPISGNEKKDDNKKNCENSDGNDKNDISDNSQRIRSPVEKDAEKVSQAELSPKKDNMSDNSLEISPSKKKRCKRMRMMESVHAKKMLLTYSSSSDTEDEQLRNALKEIKDSLLKGVSSSDDEKKKKHVEKHSSSDEEDIDLKMASKKRKCEKESSNEDSDNKSKQSSSSLKTADSERGSQSSLNSRRSKSSSKKVRFE